MATEGIQGYVAPAEANVAVFTTIFTQVSQLSGIPLVGSPDAMAHRLEELIGIVGTLSEALAHTVPIVNTHTVNTALLAARAINLEAQINVVDTKIDYSEHQRAQNQNAGGHQWTPKAASEHRAIRSIKTLGTEKAGFRLWNQKVNFSI